MHSQRGCQSDLGIISRITSAHIPLPDKKKSLQQATRISLDGWEAFFRFMEKEKHQMEKMCFLIFHFKGLYN